MKAAIFFLSLMVSVCFTGYSVKTEARSSRNTQCYPWEDCAPTPPQQPEESGCYPWEDCAPTPLPPPDDSSCYPWEDCDSSDSDDLAEAERQHTELKVLEQSEIDRLGRNRYQKRLQLCGESATEAIDYAKMAAHFSCIFQGGMNQRRSARSRFERSGRDLICLEIFVNCRFR